MIEGNQGVVTEAHRLPTLKRGNKVWTIDKRLKEFRFMVYGRIPEFVPFDSEKGLRLMKEYKIAKEGRLERRIGCN